MEHRRATSMFLSRLTEPLPPLPSSTPSNTEQLSSTSVKDLQLPPYQDVEPQASSEAGNQPPGYSPMYDYLRSQRQQHPLILQALNSPPILQVPYRDDPEPFIVQIELSQHPPPSYNELYIQHEQDMQRLIREFDENGSPAEQSEEIFKWVVAMILLALTVAGVGLAFNWGQPDCKWSENGYC